MDDQGATNVTWQDVTVAQPNQPPLVNAGPDETALVGLLYRLNASFSDPDDGGPWSYTITWGDGSMSTGRTSSPGTISVGHAYFTILPRSFTIHVTVTDAAGASGSDTKVVQVFLL
jgi:PKD domain-containing protein